MRVSLAWQICNISYSSATYVAPTSDICNIYDEIYGNIFYSETTWAVGIAQLTHHEVQGGGKNPETEGRGIFAPTADRVVS